MANLFSGVGSGSATGQGTLVALTHALRTVYSDEIYLKALPVMKFEQFATRRLELGTQPGKQIDILKAEPIKRGKTYTETEIIESNRMALTTQSITVAEAANALGFSEYLLQTSFFEQMELATTMLGRDYAMFMDIQLRDTVLGNTTNILYGTENRAAISDVTSTDYLTTDIVRWAVEKMEIVNAPKFGGDAYVSMIHPHQARWIRKDPDWVNAQLYSGVTGIFTSEIGRFEDTRFGVTTMMTQGADDTYEEYALQYTPSYDSTLAGTGASGADLYTAIFFAEDAYAYAVGLPVELRDDGVQNFGRFHKLAWYLIIGFARLNETFIARAITG